MYSDKSDTKNLQTPANYTLDPDAVAALAQLKAVYDTLSVTKTPQTPASYTLVSTAVAALARLEAIYDNLNQTEPSSALKVKRNLVWQWFKDMFEAPGLKARSPIPTSVGLSSR